MSCFLDLLRCLLCCEDEPADHYQISLGSRNRRIFSRIDDYDIEAQQAIPSRYSYSSSPSSSTTTPKLNSTSFLHHHYSYPDVNFDNSPVSPPPCLSYKPPTPQYYSSNNKPLVSSRIGPSSSSTSTSSLSPKKPLHQPKPTSSSSSDHSKHPQPFSPKSLASPSSPKPPPVFKSILSNASSSSSSSNDQRQRDGKKSTYVSVDDDSIPVFLIPEDIKDLIKRDIVPQVLKRPLSQKTYKDFFAALLYSEDFYLEKWSDFLLKNVTLELDEATVYKKRKKEDKIFVTFELDCVKERRPFLLSRDLVFAKPLGKTTPQPFQGIIHRLVSRTRVLVEFEDDFYTHHHSNQKYDISFSFNRVCLKRAHQAIETASDALFKDYLFPNCNSRASNTTAPALLISTTCHQLDQNQRSAVGQILRIQGSPPCLVAGTDCVNDWRTSHNQGEISRTGVVISEAVNQLYHKSPVNRILICAPTNSCCDVLMRSLVKKAIPESAMFRANAAFREKDEVPEDIFRSSLYRQSCFSCPPIDKLKKYRVIFSTYISSYRLHDKGIAAGHFSHMFLVDASSVIEPETLVSLTNFAVKTTSVIVTGQPGKKPGWVRADMAREKGLKISYFERLSKSLGPMLITNLNQKSDSDHHNTTRNY